MGRRQQPAGNIDQVKELVAAAMHVVEKAVEAVPKACVALTVRETAEAMRVDEDAVRTWIRNGDLEAMHLGPRQTRVPAVELAKFIRRRTTRLSVYAQQDAA